MYIVYHGNIENSKSIGTNNLIKQGAIIVTSPMDIIERYNFLKKIKKTKKKMNIEEDYLLQIFENEPLELNFIIRKSKKNTKEIIAKLTLLELEGKIKKISGNRYIRI